MITSLHTHRLKSPHHQQHSGYQSLANTDTVGVEPSNDELEAQAALIVSTLGGTYKDFVHASETYNSDFFRGENTGFTKYVVQALVQHFHNYTNLFWNKLNANLNPGVKS